MANLTKEYFDRQLKILASKDDLFTAKKDLGKQIDKLSEQNDNLAGMVQRELLAMNRKLDVKERVERLEHDMYLIKQALHISK